MASIWEKAISILAENLNSSLVILLQLYIILRRLHAFCDRHFIQMFQKNMNYSTDELENKDYIKALKSEA